RRDRCMVSASEPTHRPSDAATHAVQIAGSTRLGRSFGQFEQNNHARPAPTKCSMPARMTASGLTSAAAVLSREAPADGYLTADASVPHECSVGCVNAPPPPLTTVATDVGVTRAGGDCPGSSGGWPLYRA